MNAVTSVAWVRRGLAKSKPDCLRLDDDELNQLIASDAKNEEGNSSEDSDNEESEDNISEHDNDEQSLSSENEDKKEELSNGKSGNQSKVVRLASGKSKKLSGGKNSTGDNVIDMYDLNDYDEDEDDTDQRIRKSVGMSGISSYARNSDDPYIQGSDSDSEDELTLDADDNLIVVGKTSGDQHALEVWVFNEPNGHNLYCHHDYILPEFPLCVEWIGVDVVEGCQGNFAAVGSTASSIDIWDLDVINTLEPAFVLPGAEEVPAKKKKKLNKSTNASPQGHTDAVLALSWNRLTQTCLASGSADHTIALWDLTEGKVVETISAHRDKVQCLAWHPVEKSVLLSGSFDKSVQMFDVTSSSEKVAGLTWKLDGEVEKVVWNHHDPNYFITSSSSGHVFLFDVRGTSRDPVLEFEAHTLAVTGLALSQSISNCLVTSSEDQIVKLWDIGLVLNGAEISDKRKEKERLLSEKKCKIGSVFCAAACPDSALIIAVGGVNEMKVLNFGTDLKVRSHFNLPPLESTKGKNSEVKSSAEVKNSEVKSILEVKSSSNVKSSLRVKNASKGEPSTKATKDSGSTELHVTDDSNESDNAKVCIDDDEDSEIEDVPKGKELIKKSSKKVSKKKLKQKGHPVVDKTAKKFKKHKL